MYFSSARADVVVFILQSAGVASDTDGGWEGGEAKTENRMKERNETENRCSAKKFRGDLKFADSWG